MSAPCVARAIDLPDVDCISCHAFSADERIIAVCPNTEEIHIFQAQPDGEFQRTRVLTKHTQRVTGLDWSHAGRLVSVAEDRTAFVWDPAENWRSVHVELRAPRAALCVAWAPNGERFAVGLSSRDAAVCHFEEQVNCWVAKKVGRAKAAVSTVAWHYTSKFLAAGSFDRRCSVYDVNDAGEPPFGEAQVTEVVGAWVNAVAFSPSGTVLAVLAQDSTVRFKNLALGPEAPLIAVRWRRLPFLCAAFVDDRNLVACGFDCAPVLFTSSGASWEVRGVLDAGPRNVTPAGAGPGKRASFEGAMDRFKSMTKEGLPARDTSSESAGCWHNNTITACRALPGGQRFSTSGLDGQLVVWEFTK